MMGRQVRVLVMGHESAGRKQVIWNGLDASGRAVSAGVYLYRIDTAQNSATRKMLLMK
jgi:flagellar hook assembly protein FlgD